MQTLADSVAIMLTRPVTVRITWDGTFYWDMPPTEAMLWTMAGHPTPMGLGDVRQMEYGNTLIWRGKAT